MPGPIESEQIDCSVRVGRHDCPSPHSLTNKIGRVMWGVVWCLFFRPSPRVFLGWRRVLLRCFGATIGPGVKVMPSVRIWAPWNLTMDAESCIGNFVDCYCVDQIRIGAHATVSQYSYLCGATHDITDPNMRLTASPITIGDQAWVCADVFVAPGVTIGQGTVVGARSSVFKDLAPWVVAAGSPAKVLKKRELHRNGPDVTAVGRPG